MGSGGGPAASPVRHWTLIALLFLALYSPLAGADDPRRASAKVVSQSFALLDDFSKENGDRATARRGAVAAFAGNGAWLRNSLARMDLQPAASTLSSPQSERSAVDAELSQHSTVLGARKWQVIGQQLDLLATEIHREAAKSNPNASEYAGPPGGGRSKLPDFELGASEPPRIVIESRYGTEDAVRIQGYLEGSALKSAGIYDGATLIRPFKVNGVLSKQKLEFDLRLSHPSPRAVLRVTDMDGRVAEMAVAEPVMESAPPRPENSPGGSGTASPPKDSLTRDKSSSVGEEDENPNTMEVPSHSPFSPSPSRRHVLGSHLGGVQVEILGVTRTRDVPPTYEVVGQIAGRGITRAGIYVEGKLVQLIPISYSEPLTSFDQRVIAQGTSVAIRAYGVGNQFVEQPVDLSDAAEARPLW